MFKKFFLIYLLTLILLTVYSFSQGDPRLSIFQDQFGRNFQNNLFDFGHHQRVFSGITLTLILGSFFGCYLYITQNSIKIGWKQLKIIVVLTIIFTFLAFPAIFSYDIFLYIFYAKIIVVYEKIPWFFSPQSFSSDPIYIFIHSPNLLAQYGPVWLFISSLIYRLNSENLIFNLWSFKLLFFTNFVGIVILISKIAGELKLDPVKTLTYFIFNPFVIIEFLVNPHIDVVMIFFVLLSVLSVLQNNRLNSYFWIALSMSIKIVSLPLLLSLLLINFLKTRNPFDIIRLFFFFSLLGSLIIVLKWSINPWYFTLPITLATFLTAKKFYRYFVIWFSIALLVRYLPFTFLGFFNPANKIRLILFIIFLCPFVVWFIRNIFRLNRERKFGVNGILELIERIED